MKVDMPDNRNRNTSTCSGTRTQQPQQQEFRSSAGSFGVSASGSGSGRVNKLKPCVFCGGKHCHSQCDKVKDVEGRYEALKQKEIIHCFRCLKPGHSTPNCRSTSICFKCKGKNHHSALCTKQKQNNSTNANSSSASVGVEVSPDTPNPVSPDQGPPASDVWNFGATTGSSQQSCTVKSSMLLTATTKLRNSTNPEKIRSTSAQLFLDSGSQRSLISFEMAKKLNLLSKGSEELTLYTFV